MDFKEIINEVWKSYCNGVLTNKDLLNYYICKSGICSVKSFERVDVRESLRLVRKANKAINFAGEYLHPNILRAINHRKA